MMMPIALFHASPAKAGVQHRASRNWAPAFAGEAF
jgi:hypothetical protein